MWFSQCTVFRLPETPNAALLADKLADAPFAPCGGLDWFVLTSEFTLKRIQYLDVLQEAAENHGDNAADLAAASQLIVSANLSALIGELVELMGGWQE